MALLAVCSSLSPAFAVENTAPVVSEAIVTDFLGYDDMGQSIALQSDGKVLVGGWASDGTNDLFAISRYDSDGSLDTAFGSAGKVTADFLGDSNYRNDLALQDDGKILLVGGAYNGPEQDPQLDFAIARYNSAGNLDTAFGSDGKVLTDFFGRFDAAQSVALQADGKILVAGSTLHSNNSTYLDFALARYNSDGTPDDTFGSSGQVVTDFGTSEDLAQHITVQPDGKILVAGRAGYTNFALARYNSDGSLDDSFGSSGLVVTVIPDGGIIYKTLLQDDNKILAVGNAGAGVALVRYNSDGSLDETFGTAGKVTESSGRRSYDIALQSDGKIVVAGDNWTHNMHNDFALMRYNSDGTLDTDYGSSGYVVTGFAGGDESIQQLLLQTNGKALVAGFRRVRNEYYDFALARYNTDGSLDLSFTDQPSAFAMFGPYAFMENSAVYLNPRGYLYDAELVAQNHFAGSTFTLSRQGGANPDDYYWAVSGVLDEGYPLAVDGVAVGSVTTNSAGTLELLFNSNATPSRVNDVLQSLGYGNMSDDPAETIVFDWTFDDGNTGDQGEGGALSLTGSFTVNITSVNDAPKLVFSLSAQSATVLVPFSYIVPESSFTDPDDSTLTYSMTMADGSDVPSWLNFDEGSRTVSGTPSISGSGSLQIRITATDSSEATASDDFALFVDSDADGDGTGDTSDICPNDADDDADSDGVCGDVDVCPNTSNADQGDVDQDGIGDACDSSDTDGDGLSDSEEWALGLDPRKADSDNDGLNDAEEIALGTDPSVRDTDGDGLLDGADPAPLIAVASTASDFDYDGDGDIAWLNSENNNLSSWVMQAGALAEKHSLGAGWAGYSLLGPADLDGDGDSDLVWSEPSSAYVKYWKMQGGDITTKLWLGTGWAGYQLLAAGDLDGDGDDDLIWHNPDDYATKVWLMENGSVVQKKWMGRTWNGFRLAAVGDTDGDGDDDFIWYDPATSATKGWKMPYGARVWLGYAPLGCEILALGDFDGDGDEDVLWHDAATRKTYSWEMKFGAPVKTHWVAFSEPSFQFQQVADIDADGTMEVIWTNPGNGNTKAWHMSGCRVDHVTWLGFNN